MDPEIYIYDLRHFAPSRRPKMPEGAKAIAGFRVVQKGLGCRS